MPAYTIETTYTLPIFRHGTYIADTLDAACKAALGDDNWEFMKKDYDSSGEIHVTGIWEGENTAYAGSPITIPSQFDEAVQRRAHHFEILLGLLKMLFHDVQAARRVRSAIAAVLDVDRDFEALSPDLVSDEEIRSACESIVATIDLSDAVGNAEFHAAMTAIQAAYARLHPD